MFGGSEGWVVGKEGGPYEAAETVGEVFVVCEALE